MGDLPYEECVLLADKILELERELPEDLIVLKTFLVTYCGYAQEHDETDKIQKAINYGVRACRLCNENSGKEDDLTATWFCNKYLGISYALIGDNEKSNFHLNKAFKANPYDPDSKEGVVIRKSSNPKCMEKFYELSDKAGEFFQKNDFNNGLKSLLKIIKLYPEEINNKGIIQNIGFAIENILIFNYEKAKVFNFQTPNAKDIIELSVNGCNCFKNKNYGGVINFYSKLEKELDKLNIKEAFVYHALGLAFFESGFDHNPEYIKNGVNYFLQVLEEDPDYNLMYRESFLQPHAKQKKSEVKKKEGFFSKLFGK